MELELSNGETVTLKEVWDCCNGCNDCGSSIEVYDEDDELMCSFSGSLPDTDDEDFDINEYTKYVEAEIAFAFSF